MSKQDYDDDGRTVSDMTFTEKTTWYNTFRELSNRRSKTPKPQNIREANIELSKEETRSFIFSALLAGLSIAAVFIVTFYLFILFCIHI